MSTLDQIFEPISRSSGRRTSVDVYETLQAAILAGRLKPDTILSQVEVASVLQVSRTPVREALRMLQESGLLHGEPNYRCRVVGFDPTDIEALYTKRLVLESFGVAMTTRQMTADVLAELRGVVSALESDRAHEDFRVWQSLHRQFHRLIVVKAGDSLQVELGQLELRSERYQSAYKGSHMVGWWHRGEAEHRELFDAMVEGQAALAGQFAARHLARTALELLAALAPEFDAVRLRAALGFAVGGASAIG